MGTWLLLCPLVFATARRWRRDPRLTPRTVASQIAIAFGVAFLYATIAGTVRWTIGISVNADLGDVIASSIVGNLASNFLRYWLIAAAYHAVAYHREVRARDAEAARLESSLVQARLDALQRRLHPHFLFNTLNSIAALIRDRPDAAEQMLGSLSELLRASLNAEPSREVTLEQELDLLRQYVSIQQLRFQDRLTVSIEVGPEVLGAYVPHLVLQPFVENAIRHGIAPRDTPGHVRVAAARVDGRLQLVVEDDGIGMATGLTASQPDGSGFGLSGTEARLQQLYGQTASVAVRLRAPTGMIATVELPFHINPIAAASGYV